MDPHSTRRAFLEAGAIALGAMLMPAEGRGGALERRIPRAGEPVPAVGLGTWQVFDVAGDAAGMAQAKAALAAFVDRGGRVVDSSPMYGSSESVAGRLAAELGVRANLFVATKVLTSGRQAGIRQMEDSMKKLRVERLDLMQVHNPEIRSATGPPDIAGRGPTAPHPGPLPLRRRGHRNGSLTQGGAPPRRRTRP